MNKKIFIIAFLIPFTYYLAWYLIRFFGWYWHTKFNIPGFVFLAVSKPWSGFLNNADLLSLLKRVIGSEAKNYLLSFLTCCGFALNILLIKLSLSWVYKKLLREGPLTKA